MQMHAQMAARTEGFGSFAGQLGRGYLGLQVRGGTVLLLRV